MAKFKVKEYTPELLTELAYISKNLRFHTKKWQTYFGSPNRDNMRVWEKKMDRFLSDNLLIENNEID